MTLMGGFIFTCDVYIYIHISQMKNVKNIIFEVMNFNNESKKSYVCIKKKQERGIVREW